jgi:endonuclease I
MIVELQTKKSCGTAIADLHNLTSAIPQLSAITGQFSFFLIPFSQLMMF